MRRVIWVDGRELAYVLTSKRVRNINLRVKPDGTVSVTAPRRMSGSQVDEAVQKKASWIFAALTRLEQAEGRVRFCDGGRVPVKGEWLSVQEIRHRPGGVVRDGEILRVTVNVDAPKETAGTAVRDWLAVEARAELPQLLNRCWRVYRQVTGEERPAPPSLTLRWMVSRWGSCTAPAGRITLNLALICLPPFSAAYVVFHELAHLQQPDHSPAFHVLVARMLTAAGLPDEKELRRGLRISLRELVKG